MGKKSGLLSRMSGRSGRRFFNFTYSFGAAIVIVGAMFKIMHWPYANWILGIAMTVEALVFLLAAFDPSMSEEEESSNQGGGTNAIPQSSVQISQTSYPSGKSATNTSDKQGSDTAISSTTTQTTGTTGGGASTVVILGKSGGQALPEQQTTNSEATHSGQAVIGGQPIIIGGNQGSGFSSQSNVQPRANNNTKSELTENTRKETFNNTERETQPIDSEMVAQTVQGYTNNMDVLNTNLVELNDVYESQLKSIREQIDTMKQTNDSLERIKRLYDGAVNDGFTFRDETEKLTKNIEALNRVYERLLNAMTANNPYSDRNRDRDDRENRDRDRY